MLDWNHDGKIDYKDHAFYNNVVESGIRKDSSSRLNTSSNKNTGSNSNYSTETNSNGVIVFIVICIVYFVIKLIGG